MCNDMNGSYLTDGQKHSETMTVGFNMLRATLGRGVIGDGVHPPLLKPEWWLTSVISTRGGGRLKDNLGFEFGLGFTMSSRPGWAMDGDLDIMFPLGKRHGLSPELCMPPSTICSCHFSFFVFLSEKEGSC